MQVEQEIKRDFCPHCGLFINLDISPLNCDTCGSTDLIPTPANILADIKEMEKPKSSLQLDENAVNNILNNDFGFLCGLAGTGKSTLILELNRMYPDLFEICATTGIAAVNLNAKTLHSTLKFFNYPSLENAWREGILHYQLRMVRARKKILLIDEVSMLGADMFDLLMNAVDEINGDDTGKKLGVWITGDLMQLPAIKDKSLSHDKNGDYIFKSDYWERFAKNTVRLTKVWRQSSLEFMRGIDLIRNGKGKEAMKVLKGCGVNFTNKIDDNFQGTTLISKNDEVDRYNEKRLHQITSPLIRVCSISKGAQHKEWQKLIPHELRLKLGALVMILTNEVPEFSYVNGDLGIIESFNAEPNLESFDVRLKRTGKLVNIGRIRRLNLVDTEPEYPTGSFVPYSDFKTDQWVIGTLDYFPLRLAYASTIHKSQGLSLDMVQIDSHAQFFGFPSMAYVAISRARTPEGLYLVGSPESIAFKVKMSNEVAKYV